MEMPFKGKWHLSLRTGNTFAYEEYREGNKLARKYLPADEFPFTVVWVTLRLFEGMPKDTEFTNMPTIRL